MQISAFWHTFSQLTYNKNKVMKKMMVLMAVVLSLSSFFVAGDSDKIINALNQGNAGQFSAYFDNFLDIKLPEKDEIKNVGKTQAAITIKSFFDYNFIQQ